MIDCSAVSTRVSRKLARRFRSVLKRLASAVQVRPWPPHIKELVWIAWRGSSPLSVRIWKERKTTDAYVYSLEEPILICVPAQSALSPLLSGAWKRIAPGRAFQSGQPRCSIIRLEDPKARFQYSARRFQRHAATLPLLPRWRLERQGLPWPIRGSGQSLQTGFLRGVRLQTAPVADASSKPLHRFFSNRSLQALPVLHPSRMPVPLGKKMQPRGLSGLERNSAVPWISLATTSRSEGWARACLI